MSNGNYNDTSDLQKTQACQKTNFGMSFAEKSGPLLHQFNRLITNESFGDLTPNVNTVDDADTSSNIGNKNQKTIIQHVTTTINDGKTPQNPLLRQEMKLSEDQVSGEPLQLPEGHKNTANQHQRLHKQEEALIEQCFPKDHSIEQVSSLQLLSPLSQSMQFPQLIARQREQNASQQVIGEPLNINQQTCQSHQIMRNVLSSQTLDHTHVQCCSDILEFQGVPAQQSSMEQLHPRLDFQAVAPFTRTEQQRESRRIDEAAPRKPIATKTNVKGRKRSSSKQRLTTSGKREGQARKTNFIKKKVNQSMAFKNQAVACTNNAQLNQDLELISRLLPLIDGQIFYKKFSAAQSIVKLAFDPLHAEKNPPEQCGYGIRLFQLQQDLKMIRVRQSLRNAVEMNIAVERIVKPMVPQTTLDIIKEQKKRQDALRGPNQTNQGTNSDPQHLINEEYSILEQNAIDAKHRSITQLAKLGILDKKSEIYRIKCARSSFYPFSIALDKPAGNIELIATNPDSLQAWIFGLNFLIKNKGQSQKMQALLQLVISNNNVDYL